MTAEKDLMELARQLDRESLAEIYDLYSEDLYRYAMRAVGDQFLAEECVSETFSRFLKALHQGGGPADYLRAYLYRIAHNWLTDHFRKNLPPEIPLEFVQLPDESSPQEALSLELRQEIVRAAISRLTADQRQVILLKYYGGWSNQEVAEALGKPIGAVKSLQNRGLKAIERIILREEKVMI